MSLSKLEPAKGSLFSKKRIGRGNASGQGRTAGQGHNGYKSRSGSSKRFYFEGGQTPLMRRLPKRGFSNHLFKNSFQIVNLESLNEIKSKKIDNSTLFVLFHYVVHTYFEKTLIQGYLQYILNTLFQIFYHYVTKSI